MSRGWVVGVLMFGIACGDDPGMEDGEPIRGSAFASCTVETGCEEGLYCAQGGMQAGHCVQSCATDAECVSRLGASHACVDGDVCAQVCGFNVECTDAFDPPLVFVTCSGGLSCQSERGQALNCQAFCAAPGWGEDREPGTGSFH